MPQTWAFNSAAAWTRPWNPRLKCGDLTSRAGVWQGVLGPQSPQGGRPAPSTGGRLQPRSGPASQPWKDTGGGPRPRLALAVSPRAAIHHGRPRLWALLQKHGAGYNKEPLQTSPRRLGAVATPAIPRLGG